MDLDFHFTNARRLTNLLDTKFNILGFKFGLDPLLDLIPGFGSLVGGFTSLYLFWIALQLDLPKKVYGLLLGNIIIDWILGSVPFAGVVMDAFYKSNVRNLKILEKYHNLKYA